MISPTSTTALKLTPSNKEYIYSHIDGKSSHESQCAKTRALKGVIDLIIEIKSFEQQCVILKILFQSD